MSRLPLVHVVILNWNKPEETRRCIASVLAAGYSNQRILVVDNGSDAGMGPGEGAEYRLIRNSRNLGFAGGMNVGMRHAMQDGADYVWLLNNDATVLLGALDALVREAEAQPDIGLLSPAILQGERLDFHGGVWEAGGTVLRTTSDPPEYARWARESPERIWLVGAALLVRRALVERIGGLDERYFAYWEDNDYAIRASRAGYRSVVVGEARVQHDFGTSERGTTARPPYYFYFMSRNEIFYLRQLGGLLRHARPLAWMLQRQRRVLARLCGRPECTEALLQGICDGLLGRGGPWRPARPSPLRRRLAGLLAAE